MTSANNRQSFLSDNLDDILENCVIGVVGLGGGGSQIVQQLGHIGFKRYVLCDFDTIEDTNLNRLVGATLVDVETLSTKLSIAVRLIRALQPNANIIQIPRRFQEGAEQLKQCDIIFGCLDGYQNRRQLEAMARSALIPYIDIGMDVRKPPNEPPRMGGQVIASVPGRPCMWCYGFLTNAKLEEEDRHYGDTGVRPQVIWPNAILASTAVHICLNLLTDWNGQGETQTLYFEYNGNKGEITPHPRYLRERGRICPHFRLHDTGDREL